MNTPIRDLLQIKGTAVETILPGATILEAIKRMSTAHIGCLVVVGKVGHIAGIITERDCMWKVVAVGKSSRTTLVKDTMTPVSEMTLVSPSHTVDDCMEIMTTQRHRHLPVVDHGELRGIITIGDLMAREISEQENTIKYLNEYMFGHPEGV